MRGQPPYKCLYSHVLLIIQYPKQIRVVREWTTLDGEDISHPLQIQQEPEVPENDARRRAQKVNVSKKS